MSPKTPRFRPRDFMEKWGEVIALAGGAILVAAMLAVGIAGLPGHRVPERDFTEPPAPNASSAPKRPERIEPLPERHRLALSREWMLAERHEVELMRHPARILVMMAMLALTAACESGLPPSPAEQDLVYRFDPGCRPQHALGPYYCGGGGGGGACEPDDLGAPKIRCDIFGHYHLD